MNPQGHKGKFFELQQAPQSMSSLRGLVGKHGIYALRRRFVIFCPFFLIRKGERIKADIKGQPHIAGAPPPCRPGLPAQPGQGLASPVY